MKISTIVVSIAFLWSNVYRHSVAACDASTENQQAVIQYGEEESIDHTHFDHDNDDHQHQHDHLYRGLRKKEMSRSMVVSNQTYSSKYEFIQSGHRCGSKEPSAEKMKELDEKIVQWMKDNTQRTIQTKNIEIQTYFHVITSGQTGAISDATLKRQLSVLNRSFNPYSFSFKLQGTTRTNNTKWYTALYQSKAAIAMFKKLRVGGASTLNVYFSEASGFLGYAAFPDTYEENPVEDGVVIASGSVPGGDIPDYDEGKTLVHEVGHWLSLYHTFTGVFVNANDEFNGCIGEGDFVSDTPRQKSPTFGCPARKDTCPRNWGLDMVSNFMDYSDDVCMTQFTAGQRHRMLAMWDLFRANK